MPIRIPKLKFDNEILTNKNEGPCYVTNELEHANLPFSSPIDFLIFHFQAISESQLIHLLNPENITKSLGILREYWTILYESIILHCSRFGGHILFNPMKY